MFNLTTMEAFALALIPLLCALTIYGHPAAQIIPLRMFADPYQYQSMQGRSFAQPEQQLKFASAKPTCLCKLGGDSCPNCRRADEEPTIEYSIDGNGIPQRFLRSVPVSSSPVDDDDSSFMKTVRSALLAIEPLFGGGELRVLSPQRKSAQHGIPIDNLLSPAVPISDIRTQKMRLGNSPAEVYGMCYMNVHVESFDANPDDEYDKGRQADAQERQTSKERKIDEQQAQIMDALEQLSQGQVATMMAQLDAELMTEQEFSLQESYLREIKHQLNSLRAAGEARDRVTNGATATPSSAATAEKGMSDSQLETTTSIDETLDTTPAPELQSTASTESTIA